MHDERLHFLLAPRAVARHLVEDHDAETVARWRHPSRRARLDRFVAEHGVETYGDLDVAVHEAMHDNG